ncbi:FUSC family protein [Streptomyces sp. NPDC057137]|uniref:FUSC family protein n=1 Tax=Streptomyces sp. NPDC057137 TaxID=3346030 RepID=UPI003626057B
MPALPQRLELWLTTRDRGLLALRRAGRTAIVMSGTFAFCDQVIGNPETALFAAFGSFSMLMLVDFGGPMRERLQAQAALAAVGMAFVCVGTLASQAAWLACLAMAVVGFGVLLAGAVSSVLAGASTSLLLAFILPVSLPGTAADVPERLAGWGLAAVVGLFAIRLLWPEPAANPLRGKAVAACRALAARLRSEAEHPRSGREYEASPEHRQVRREAHSAMDELQRQFLTTPYRPTGLSAPDRAVVRLVDELNWAKRVIVHSRPIPVGAPNLAARRARIAAANVLGEGADLLAGPRRSPDALRAASAELRASLSELDRDAADALPPLSRPGPGPGPHPRPGPGPGPEDGAEASTVSPDEMTDQQVTEVIDALEPSFRAHELAFVVSAIGDNIDAAARAERRTWSRRLLGRQSAGLPGTLSSAHERASAHVEPHSVWLHNSVRGAVGLALAVLVANLTDLQHAFWVVLGALSVLRSNALSTGQNALRAVLGTAVGFAIGALLMLPVGDDTTPLWFLLPVMILVAGIAPAVISFAAGQAAFTLELVILFNILQPTGWRVGLVRIEDVAIGCGVSIMVGVLFWPRGATAALNQALSEAYTDSANYLAAAVEFAMRRPSSHPVTTAVDVKRQAVRAASAARRMDDAFRQYLSERGAKTTPLAEFAMLIGGVIGLRLAADTVLHLWERADDQVPGDRTAARRALLQHMRQVTDWYDDFARNLAGGQPLPRSPDQDAAADRALVRTLSEDLRSRNRNGIAAATAVRMIWTGDHLDALRRNQPTLVQPVLTAGLAQSESAAD